MTAPRYQPLAAQASRWSKLPDGAGTVRVIAGEFGNARGAARTFTPINLLDVRLAAGKRVTLDLKDGYTAALYVLDGEVVISGQEIARATADGRARSQRRGSDDRSATRMRRCS